MQHRFVMKLSQSQSKYFFSSLFFLGTLLVSGYFARLDPNWHHDGILFKPASDVAAGLSLFRETFSQYGALTTYLQAAAIAVFGKSLLVVRYEAAIFLSLTSAFFYLIVREIVPTSIAVLAVVLWICLAPFFTQTFLPWSSIYALFFAVLGTWLLIKGVNFGSLKSMAWGYCFAAGLCFAASFWTRQPTGILFPVMFSLFLFCYLDRSTSRRTTIVQALSYVCGFLFFNAVIFSWLFIDDALLDWWKQSIQGASSFAGQESEKGSIFQRVVRYLFPNPGRIHGGIESNIWRGLPAVNIAILFILGIGLARKHKQTVRSRSLLALCLLSFGSWHQYFPISGLWQIYWGASPMIGVAVAGTYLGFRHMRLPSQCSAILLVLFSMIVFGKDVHHRLTEAVGTFPISPIEFPTLEGMQLSNKFSQTNRVSGSIADYVTRLNQLGQFLSGVEERYPDVTLITFSEDAYLSSLLSQSGMYESYVDIHPDLFAAYKASSGRISKREWGMNHYRSYGAKENRYIPESSNGHKVTFLTPRIIQLYPENNRKLSEFIKHSRPLIEVKKGFHKGIDWGPGSRIWQAYGFSDYQVLIETDYSDGRESLILVAPEHMSRYSFLLDQN
ncbi:MAG: hypothetical protein EVB05_07145 [Candidatus Thioglobus sp.]|nr:MAG: hypothetical protein EVB05_07145 [Candidatus Thioglobus sp.]